MKGFLGSQKIDTWVHLRCPQPQTLWSESQQLGWTRMKIVAVAITHEGTRLDLTLACIACGHHEHVCLWLRHERKRNGRAVPAEKLADLVAKEVLPESTKLCLEPEPTAGPDPTAR